MRAVLRRWAERAIPPPPTADPDIQEWIERVLFAQAVHLNSVVASLSAPTAAVWVALLWAQSDRRRLLLWFVLVGVSSAAMALSTRGWDRATSPVEAGARRLSTALVFAGVTWGLIAWLWEPADASWQPLVGMLVIAPMAANTIFTASVPRLFWSFQLGAVVTAVTALLVNTHPSTQATMLIILYALPFSALLAKIKGSSDQHAAYFAATARQIAQELKATNADLAYEASHDTLTGLANRDTFTTELEQSITDGRRVGVLLIDLDHFKSVNDTLGHAMGDAVLCGTATRVGDTLRQGDLLARLGGDEFTILVQDIHDLGEIRTVAERVLRAFTEPMIIEGREHRVNVSVGAAVHEEGTSSSSLLQAADAALYEAKRLGRATYRVYDEHLRSRIAVRLDAERAVAAALANQEIVGWLQPIVDLRTGEIVSAESLARWLHPDGRVRTAGEFLEPIENDRLMADVTRSTGASAAMVRDRLRAEGYALKVGVNVPPGSINELLDQALKQEDLAGIAVEITETGVIADPLETRRRLAECRARGAEVWLDDFGTGQSSLSLLTELPLDGVKIDKSFVRAMAVHREARTVVVAIIEMAKTLGLAVIAEGVETVEQACVLRDMGAELGQGFLFSPAVPAQDLARMLREGRNWAHEIGERRSDSFPG